MNRVFILGIIFFVASCADQVAQNREITDSAAKQTNSNIKEQQKPSLDTAKYNQLQQYINGGDTTGRWPVKHEYPTPGAVLPFNRIIAYYGNLYSTRMGALGEFPKNEMLQKLMAEVKKWSDKDSVIKAIPALHYIAVTAQLAAGKDGKYRARMPHSQIDTVINWAKEINALVFIDVQVGLSTIQHELPEFEKYLSMPNVHLGIDPEFAMVPKGKRPGTVVGTYDASDINFVTNYLADLVKKNNIPPKILVVHRFTQGMVTNYSNITLRPEVQIVMHMDGWGGHAKKIGTYRNWIFPQPVQFTGVKLFYKHDTEKSGEKELLPISTLLNLVPKPVYIQYQ
jgi:hypothetical protein